jgi:hypothetical protein
MLTNLRIEPILANYFDINGEATTISLGKMMGYVQQLQEILGPKYNIYIDYTRDALINLALNSNQWDWNGEKSDISLLRRRELPYRVDFYNSMAEPYEHREEIISHIRAVIEEDLKKTQS